MTNLLLISLTAYCHCAACCGRPGQPTASGVMPALGVTLAAPRAVPLGTRVFISGLGWRVVQDRTASRIDGWDVFLASHRRAQKFGRKNVWVRIEK
jgi:3D (Asp-Asp-Asp) domain-containing protein